MLTGTPVANQIVTFSRGQAPGGPSVTCSNAPVRTASNGTATCALTAGELTAVLFSGGFTATFADTPPYFGSKGSAGVL